MRTSTIKIQAMTIPYLTDSNGERYWPIYDSERRWDVGDFVRTSLLHQHEGFHFKTLNTVYLLLGPGTRLQVSADAVASIF